MDSKQIVYVGIKGRVFAIDAADGAIVWETVLSNSILGEPFVNLFCDGDLILAHSKGAIYCLEASTGQVRWTNPLAGLGYGIATFASPRSSGTTLAALVEKIREEAQAASSAAAMPAS